MKEINSYIIEKLHLNKDIEISKELGDKINPTDADAEDVCKQITNAKEKITKHINGRVYSTYIKLIIQDGYFLVRPDDIKDDEEIDETSEIGPAFLHDLNKAKLGHLFIIDGQRYSQGITYHYFFFGRNGKIFNNKKEAKSLIDVRNSRFSPWDTSKGRYMSLRYKPITIEEASKIPWDRTTHKDDLRFY